MVGNRITLAAISWVDYILAGLNSARPPWHERPPPLAQAGVPTINTVTWVVSIGGGSCHYTINDHIVCPGDLRPGFRSLLLSRIHVSNGWVSTRLPWTCHRLAFSCYFETSMQPWAASLRKWAAGGLIAVEHCEDFATSNLASKNISGRICFPTELAYD